MDATSACAMEEATPFARKWSADHDEAHTTKVSYMNVCVCDKSLCDCKYACDLSQDKCVYDSSVCDLCVT